MNIERLHGRQTRLTKMIVYEHNKPGKKIIRLRFHYAAAGCSFYYFLYHVLSLIGSQIIQTQDPEKIIGVHISYDTTRAKIGEWEWQSARAQCMYAYTHPR